MDRRTFVRLLAAAPLAGSCADPHGLPPLRVVSSYGPAATPGMPGPYPGRVVAVSSDEVRRHGHGRRQRRGRARDDGARHAHADRAPRSTAEAWRRFFEPSDVVGIKVNCGGYPVLCLRLRDRRRGRAPADRASAFRSRRSISTSGFRISSTRSTTRRILPDGVQIVAAERANRNVDNSGYDPAVYLEADLFGEDDTRSNMMRLVTQRLTKIINIPNMKDHGATGVTGCLKNIAYGSFSNVARTHQRGKSHTYSVVGTLATIEPLRSRTVLQIMDGLRGVWHGGPFARTTRYVFYPRQIMFGTDPVAIDRLLLDIIDDKRKAEGAISIWDRSPRSLKIDDTRARDADPNVNIIIREPGHVEYASTLGLGVYDRSKITVQDVKV